MKSDDPIIELLQTVDAATDIPRPPIDLSDRVRRRTAQHAAAGRRRKYATACAAAAVALVAVALVRPPLPLGEGRGEGVPKPRHVATRPTDGPDNAPPTAYRLPPTGAGLPTAHRPPPTEVATLRAEADALAAEADALQRQISRMRTQDSRLALLDECRELAAQTTDESPLDRTAIIALCRGDMLWQDYQARDAAAEAWQSVIKNFPDTHWAIVAHARMEQLPMN